MRITTSGQSVSTEKIRPGHQSVQRAINIRSEWPSPQQPAYAYFGDKKYQEPSLRSGKRCRWIRRSLSTAAQEAIDSPGWLVGDRGRFYFLLAKSFAKRVT